MNRNFVDIAMAAGLLGSILLIFFVEPHRPPTQQTQITDVEQASEIVAKESPLKIAVTPDYPGYDDVGHMLDTLGSGFAYTKLPFDHLLEVDKLREFDVVFITCSGYPPSWLGSPIGGTRRGQDLYTQNPEIFARAHTALRQFVEAGGTLYTSDLHFPLISDSFPDWSASPTAVRGSAQSLLAEVVDDGLRESIGAHVRLTFDQEGWFPAELDGPGITTYLRGEFLTDKGKKHSAALLVKIPYGQGSVIFTSFHNEKQTSKQEMQLLKYLVFSTVTAGMDSEVDRQLAQGGFSRTKQNLFAATPGSQSATREYHNASVNDLQFVLAFSSGAELELEIQSPDNKKTTKKDTETIVIEIPNAPIGTWTYTVRAINVPNDNFPFTINIGAKP